MARAPDLGNSTIEVSQQVLYRGTDGVVILDGTYSGLPVAIKRLDCISHKERIENEIEILKKNNVHENIIRYYSHKRDPYFVYIAMERAQGSLDDLVSGKYEGTSPGNNMCVLRQITEGLAYLQSKKIVHRDLKPQNILISKEDGNVPPKMKLIDFGISKKQTRENYFSKTYSSLGTLGWAAPELMDGDRDTFDYSVDIFALGCIFGYVLTGGHHPFGDDPIERGPNIKKNELHWKEESSIMDNDLKKLVLDMISRDPKKRPGITKIQEIFYHHKHHSDSAQKSLLPEDAEIVGIGSHGTIVFKIKHENQTRAVKRIRKWRNKEEISNEIKILTDTRMSSCAYLIRYYSHETDNKYCCIYMEYCVRGSLDKLIEAGSWKADHIFLQQIVEGIKYLHEMDVIHRDIKPANVLLSNDAAGRYIPKISDFGISNFWPQDSNCDQLVTTQCRGTPGWMAPEVQPGAEITKETDVFSLGCVLFYAASSGFHPFQEDITIKFHQDNKHGMAVQTAIRSYSLGYSELIKLVEPTMLDLVSRAIQKDQNIRITSSEMLQHPAFWSSDGDCLKPLRFLQECWDGNQDLMKRKLDSDDRKRRYVICNNWRNCLEPEVNEIVDKGKEGRKLKKSALNGESAVDLLIFIRNKSAHFVEIETKVKGIIGISYEEYFKYLSRKFPCFFIYVWRAREGKDDHCFPLPPTAIVKKGLEQPYLDKAEGETAEAPSIASTAVLDCNFNNNKTDGVSSLHGGTIKSEPHYSGDKGAFITSNTTPQNEEKQMQHHMGNFTDCSWITKDNCPEFASVGHDGQLIRHRFSRENKTQRYETTSLLTTTFHSVQPSFTATRSLTTTKLQCMACLSSITPPYHTTYIISGDELGSLFCFDLDSGVVTSIHIGSKKGTSLIKRVSVSPPPISDEEQDRYILTEATREIQVLQLHDGNFIRVGKVERFSESACWVSGNSFAIAYKLENGAREIVICHIFNNYISIGRSTQAHKSQVNSIAKLDLSITWTLVASCSEDKTVKIWDYPELNVKYVFDLHDSSVTCIEWLPASLQTLGDWHTSKSPLIASGCAKGTIFIWESLTGKILHKFEAHYKRVNSMSFASNGLPYFASGGNDGQVKLWSLRSLGGDSTSQAITSAAEDRNSLEGSQKNSRVWKVGLNKDCSFLGAGFQNGKVTVWKLCDYYCGSI